MAQQVLAEPARYIHTTVMPAPMTDAQLIDRISAADDAVKRDIIRELLRHASPAVRNDVAASASQSVNQQLIALQWNRLPSTALSNVLSYLTTKQVLQLRRVSKVWNKTCRQGASFNTSAIKDSVLELTRPGTYSLNGVRAVALHVPLSAIQNWPEYENGYHEYQEKRATKSQGIYTQLLDCVLQHTSSVDTLVSTHVSELPAFDGWQTFEYPCWLTTLIQHPLSKRIKRLHQHLHKFSEAWELLAAAEPFPQLIEFHCWVNAHFSSSTHVTPTEWGVVLQLMPHLQTLELTFSGHTPHNLQPILRLPNLTRLSIKRTWRRERYTAEGSAEEMFGTTPPVCKLRYLQLAGDNNMQRLLTEDVTTGLRTIAQSVTQLSLYDVEYNDHFATHLAGLHHLASLELLSASWPITRTAQHRRQLLTALKSLPALRTLRLLIENRESNAIGSTEITTDTEYYKYSDEDMDDWREPDNFWLNQRWPVDWCWTAEELSALLRLPLEELTVQHLTYNAGQALTVLLGGESLTLRRLKLGVTTFDWDTVAAAADRLESLQLPAKAKPQRPPRKGSRKRLKRAPLPANVTFLKEWSNKL